MQTLVLAVSTGIVFLILDAIMLTFFLQPLFMKSIGHLMVDPIRLGPAAAFYALYVFGVLALVSLPALRNGTSVLVPAFILGLVAYGTYELTSFTLMRDWNITMVVADMLWGGVLTMVSAWGGIAITRALVQ